METPHVSTRGQTWCGTGCDTSWGFGGPFKSTTTRPRHSTDLYHTYAHRIVRVWVFNVCSFSHGFIHVLV